MKLPIIYNDLVNKSQYESQKIEKYIFNCHIGHIKLLCVVLEFLYECQNNNIGLDDAFIVYIGSAPGISLNIINQLYPNILWLLYDKNKFIIEDTHNYILKYEYFYDENVEDIKRIFKNSKRKYLLFICDMRKTPDEASVFRDMLDQQKWCIECGADAYCMKFRLPYYYNDSHYDYNFDSSIIDKIINPNEFENKINNMVYLDGTIYLQTFAPKRSTETRLIGFSKNKKYKMNQYDILEYEQKMNYFNTKLRTDEEFEYNNSREFLLNNSYDSVREYYIYSKFNEINHKFDNIKQIYDLVNNTFRKYHIVNTFDCETRSFIKNLKFVSKSDKYSKEYKTNYISFAVNYIKSIIDKINSRNYDYNIWIDNNIIKRNKDKKLYIDEDMIKKLIIKN